LLIVTEYVEAIYAVVSNNKWQPCVLFKSGEDFWIGPQLKTKEACIEVIDAFAKRINVAVNVDLAPLGT